MMLSVTHDLPALLAAAGSGDRRAFAVLYERFHALVRSKAHRRIQSRLRRFRHPLLALLSTGDVVQEVFRDLFTDLGEIECTSEAEFVALLTTLVEHRLVDQLRHHHAQSRDIRRRTGVESGELDLAAPTPDPFDDAARREHERIYEELLEATPLRERALLRMRLRDEAPFDEIACALAFASVDAARKAFYRAHARLLVALARRGVRESTAIGRVPEKLP
jgi:RNA polymerase sigma factor (sigma-70 family)